MESIKELYKIGYGPSSSHTMGPQKAASDFIKLYPNATKFKCELYDSLAATGKGHLTDYIIIKEFKDNDLDIEVVFKEDVKNDYHPNSLKFIANNNGKEVSQIYYSVGGGKITKTTNRNTKVDKVYDLTKMTYILKYCNDKKLSIPQYVYKNEQIKDYLEECLSHMFETIENGLIKEGSIPGKLFLKRKAKSIYEKYNNDPEKDVTALLYSLALAASEENASGSIVVTAPTCGASGVLPSVLKTFQLKFNKSNDELVDALAIAGLIGNLAKFNASISGAEVGCQGEVGVACSMAAGAICYLLGGTNEEIEYAAEIAMEHCLGMTCDPVFGLVQIPCIERNAMAAKKAFDAAKFALLSDGSHVVSLDICFKTMYQTGIDMKREYRETALGGLAKYIELQYKNNEKR